MYDILVYLFENCQQHELFNEKDQVAKKLSAAGFDDSDISEALTWIAGIARAPHRSFAPLAANGDGLTLEQLKLVVLMVLWNQQTPSSRLIAEDLLSPATARVPS
jgi:uncharacterized protein Smg (DUF494 family)